MKEYFHIGKLIAATGLKGEIILQHQLGKKTDLNGVEALFLPDGKDNFIPWFPESTKAKNTSEIIVKLEGIDTPETAKKFVPKEVWLSSKDFSTHTATSSPLSLLGFTIVENKVSLGEISEVIEQPHQLLCTISYLGKEALIPLHEQSLLKIDRKAKKIEVKLPEGLLDIYK